MANSRNSGVSHEYATVDTAPAAGSAGYFTNAVCAKQKKIKRMFFSIRETTDDSSPSVVTVKLQFKCNDDSGWTDYVSLGSETLAIGNRLEINDLGTGTYWRAGVADDLSYTSGSITFGFDW